MRKSGIIVAILLGWVMAAPAQTEVMAEAQLTASDGDHTPLWLNANRYGLSSLDRNNSYVRAGAFHSYLDDSTARAWRFGYGADVAVAAGFTSTLVVQQAYADVAWHRALLTVGSKEQPLELKNQELSTGSQTLGVNARPVPAVRLAVPDYWDIPGTRGVVGVKGHISYGWTTDDRWQRDFTQRRSKYTEHTMLHTKAGYVRLGRADKPFNVEMGLEMGCQFGGSTYDSSNQQYPYVKSEGGLKGMLHALIPAGGDAVETDYRNTEGNHVGSWLLRANYDADAWGVSAYADHFFEDQSQMFLLDYDGYGTGDDWDTWKHFNMFVYDLRDMQLGLELRLRRCRWVGAVVAEYVYSKYQSGPIYHDHTRTMSDHLGGLDDYYNHYIFTGWQHWGQVMGNPLFRSPLYNESGEIKVLNNRFKAWHLGLSGTPLRGLHYRVLATWQRGFGTYRSPLPAPQENVSLLAEAAYTFGQRSRLAGWQLRGAIALDRGKLLGDNTGAQFTVSRRMSIRTKR